MGDRGGNGQGGTSGRAIWSMRLHCLVIGPSIGSELGRAISNNDISATEGTVDRCNQKP